MTLASALFTRKRSSLKSRRRRTIRKQGSIRNQQTVSSLTGELSSPCPPKSLRFFYTTWSREVDGVAVNDFWGMKISSIDIEPFRKLDKFRYIQHDHSFGDPLRFRRISTQCDYLFTMPDGCASCTPVVVGSVIYILYYYAKREAAQFVFQSFDLDTRVTTNLPVPFSPKRFFSRALSLRGKIYFFETLAFNSFKSELEILGDVFDTAINKWFILRHPPDSGEYGNLLITSLGETEGKLMVYYQPYSQRWARIYIYDVTEEVWESHHHPCDVWPISTSRVDPSHICGMEIINEDDNTLYWLNENHFICAFDWKAKQFYTGPVVGMEHETGQIRICPVALEHVWRDFFYLISYPVHLNKSITTIRTDTTEYHFTFVRVIKNKLNGTLVAFVVGCFMELFDHTFELHKVIRA